MAISSAQRIEALKRAHGKMRDGSYRESVESMRDCVSQIVPLLKFDATLHANAQQAADILSRPGFSSSMYEHMEGRLDTIVAQAIVALEHGLDAEPTAATLTPQTPTPTPTPTVTSDSPVQLREEHGLFWFFRHSTSKTQLAFVATLGAVFMLGFAFGRHSFFTQLYDLITASATPSASQTVTTNMPTKR